MHAELQQKRIEEASAGTSRSIEIETLVSDCEETAITDSCSSSSREVQTESVLHDDKSANREQVRNWCYLPVIFYFHELFANRICEAKKVWRSATTKHIQNNNGMLSIKQLVPICST